MMQDAISQFIIHWNVFLVPIITLRYWNWINIHGTYFAFFCYGL